jgi:hypothetical protein
MYTERMDNGVEEVPEYPSYYMPDSDDYNCHDYRALTEIETLFRERAAQWGANDKEHQ